MRLVRSAVVTTLFLAAAALLAPHALPGDRPPDDPFAAADRHEAEGRALLERGEKVAGAKHMIEAWSLRARAWARAEGGEGDPREQLAALRAKSAAAEQEAHALRAAGKTEEADARIEESSRLWKKAEALEAALRERAAKDADRKGRDGAPDDAAAAALERRRAMAAKVKALEAEAAELWAAGKLGPAEERLAKAAALRSELGTPPAKAGPTAPDAGRRAGDTELAGEVRRLRKQVEDLRALVEDLRARWPAAATPAPAPTPVPTPTPK